MEKKSKTNRETNFGQDIYFESECGIECYYVNNTDSPVVYFLPTADAAKVWQCVTHGRVHVCMDDSATCKNINGHCLYSKRLIGHSTTEKKTDDTEVKIYEFEANDYDEFLFIIYLPESFNEENYKLVVSDQVTAKSDSYDICNEILLDLVSFTYKLFIVGLHQIKNQNQLRNTEYSANISAKYQTIIVQCILDYFQPLGNRTNKLPQSNSEHYDFSKHISNSIALYYNPEHSRTFAADVNLQYQNVKNYTYFISH